jgi:tryptophan synthase alpha chain
LQQLKLRNPVLIGFGIRDKASFDAACRHANGAIIGTAYIRAIEKAADVDAATREFLSGVVGVEAGAI